MEPLKLLAVDDDDEFLHYLRHTLGKAGYEIACAPSTALARRRLSEDRFAVVLADLRLPGSSGLDLLREVRAQDPLSVGIILTAHGSVDSAMEALRDGVYDYMVKPCAPDALLAAVRRAVEHHRLNAALISKTAQLEKLERQLHDKSRMIQNVSHELKNPLSVVYGYSAFLLREELPPEDLKRSLQSIHNNAERLGHLLEELVESTRLAGGKVELERRPLRAAALCHEALENHRFEATKGEVELRLDCRAPEALVWGDAKRLHQILSNLLANALKFTPEGGTVTLSAVEQEGAVRFTVRDTGVGISTQDLPHLFERFYQAENTRKNHAGLGLGLEICKGLVQLHGGRIWADSAPGEGSSFHFTIPLAAAPKAADAKKKKTFPEPA